MLNGVDTVGIDKQPVREN